MSIECDYRKDATSKWEDMRWGLKWAVGHDEVEKMFDWMADTAYENENVILSLLQ